MTWAAMPKTAVHEHGDLRPAEYDVRPTSKRPQGPHINGVAKAARMEETADLEFGRGVALRRRLHSPSDGRR